MWPSSSSSSSHHPGARQRLLNTLEANADVMRREWRELADARREGAGCRGKGQGGGDGGKGAVSSDAAAPEPGPRRRPDGLAARRVSCLTKAAGPVFRARRCQQVSVWHSVCRCAPPPKNLVQAFGTGFPGKNSAPVLHPLHCDPCALIWLALTRLCLASTAILPPQTRRG